jgi:hypothetical protein
MTSKNIRVSKTFDSMLESIRQQYQFKLKKKLTTADASEILVSLFKKRKQPVTEEPYIKI